MNQQSNIIENTPVYRKNNGGGKPTNEINQNRTLLETRLTATSYKKDHRRSNIIEQVSEIVVMMVVLLINGDNNDKEEKRLLH